MTLSQPFESEYPATSWNPVQNAQHTIHQNLRSMFRPVQNTHGSRPASADIEFVTTSARPTSAEAMLEGLQKAVHEKVDEAKIAVKAETAALEDEKLALMDENSTLKNENATLRTEFLTLKEENDRLKHQLSVANDIMTSQLVLIKSNGNRPRDNDLPSAGDTTCTNNNANHLTYISDRTHSGTATPIPGSAPNLSDPNNGQIPDGLPHSPLPELRSRSDLRTLPLGSRPVYFDSNDVNTIPTAVANRSAMDNITDETLGLDPDNGHRKRRRVTPQQQVSASGTVSAAGHLDQNQTVLRESIFSVSGSRSSDSELGQLHTAQLHSQNRAGGTHIAGRLDTIGDLPLLLRVPQASIHTYEKLSALPEAEAAIIWSNLNAAFCVAPPEEDDKTAKSHDTHHKRFLTATTAKNREKTIHSGCCLGMWVRQPGKDKTFASTPDTACVWCVRTNRPCARLEKLGGVVVLVLYPYQMLERDAGKEQWKQAPYWISVSSIVPQVEIPVEVE